MIVPIDHQFALNGRASRIDSSASKQTPKFFGCVLCLAALLFTLPARAAVDIFLDFLPTIPGESQDSTYANKVDVLAWSWGMSQSGTTHLGPGSGAGKVSVQDISITKFVDKASPRLMEYCANGAKLTSAFLIVRKAGTTNTYIKITMADIIVAGVSSGGSGGEDRLTENIVLNFARVKFEYFPTKADGTPDPNAPAPFTWNIPQNISTWE